MKQQERYSYPAERILEKESNRRTRPSMSNERKLGTFGYKKKYKKDNSNTNLTFLISNFTEKVLWKYFQHKPPLLFKKILQNLKVTTTFRKPAVTSTIIIYDNSAHIYQLGTQGA